MGYRLPEPREPFNNTVATTRITVDNGTITHWKIQCFDSLRKHGCFHPVFMHNHHYHVVPNRPPWHRRSEHSYHDQLWIDREPRKTDLEWHGYTDVHVALANAPTGLKVEADIDYNTINLVVTAQCPSVKEKDAEADYAVYVSGETYDGPVRSVIAKGKLHVVAGQI